MISIRKPKILYWTAHSRAKMHFYGLSESRVKRILNSPHRVEEGIAPKTIAVMQKTVSKKPHELWVMIQDEKGRRKIISAWRYPGETKPRSENLKNILREEYINYASKKE